MITVALGLVLILTGVLALLWLRALRIIREQAILIRHQGERIAVYRAELEADPADPAGDAALIPIEAARYLATVTPPAEES